MLEIIQLPILSDNYTYVIHDPSVGETIVIDPGEAGPVLACLDAKNWPLKAVINTHHHLDHVNGNHELQYMTACELWCSHYDKKRIAAVTKTLQEGSTFTIGQYKCEVWEIPGHTLGHIAIWCEAMQALFSGDTLFPLGCGRLFEGSSSQIFHSLERIKRLPPTTLIYGAHEYTLRNAPFALEMEPDNETLIARIAGATRLRQQSIPTVPTELSLELATNPFLRTESLVIRKKLGLEQASNEKIFAELRHLRDQW